MCSVATKQVILDNVEEYSPKELADLIRQGVVSLEELERDREVFSRRRSQEVRAELEAEERGLYQRAMQGGAAECEAYLQVFPNQEASREVRARLEQLRREEQLRQEHAAMCAQWEQTVRTNTIEEYQAFLLLYPNCELVAEAHDRIQQLYDAEAAKAWAALQGSNNEWALKDFIRCYPDSSYASEAKALLEKMVDYRLQGSALDQLLDFLRNPFNKVYATSEIIKRIESKAVDRHEFLSQLRGDINLISSQVMLELIRKGIYMHGDLLDAGFEDDVVDMLKRGKKGQNFDKGAPLEQLQSPYTEVFFWGIPSSGKTCALGALLSTASHRGMDTNIDCQGLDYMNRLSNVFSKSGLSCLPGSTPTDAIYEMCFSLTDAKKRRHPLSFIDLAGELFRAIYADKAGRLTEDLEESLRILEDIIINQRSTNRKIHFFVLEYGGHRRDIDGIKQSQYLEVAAKWLEQKGVLDKDTDGIYILMTKSDLAQREGEDLVEELRRYISEHYHGFYIKMRSLCQKHEINRGNLEVLPFTIGEVIFQNYCRFSDVEASLVLDKLVDESATLGRTGLRGKLLSFFSN